MFIICAHWKAHFDISMLSMTSYINCYLIWSFGLLFCASQMIESARCCYPEDKHLTIFQTFSFNCISTRLPSEGGKCKDPLYLSEPLHIYTRLEFPLGLYAVTKLVLRLGIDGVVTSTTQATSPKHKNLSFPILRNSAAILIKYLTLYLSIHIGSITHTSPIYPRSLQVVVWRSFRRLPSECGS